MDSQKNEIRAVDMTSLEKAVALLEAPSLSVKLTNTLGSPIEAGMAKLPESVRESIQLATRRALEKSADVAFATFSKPDVVVSAVPAPEAEAASSGLADRAKGMFGRLRAATIDSPGSFDMSHKIAVAATGAVGGMFGFTAMLAELPASTVLILRSIADIARDEGADLAAEETRQECLQVFALGAPGIEDDAMESAYYASRTAMSVLVRQTGVALAEIAAKQAGKQAGSAATSSVLKKVIEAVASRFGIVVTEKMAAQAVPVLGAITGATINTMFMSHFQDVARGHFIVRRLESTYGPHIVQAEYQRIRSSLKLQRNGGGMALARPVSE